MRLRAIVVDDEELARENLKMMLSDFCVDEIEVIGEADEQETAKERIENLSPDVVFLDIRMPSGIEGFKLLESIENKKFLVVFVTAFKEYAIKAFHANAVHYLMKPIDIDDLREAVNKLVEANQIFTENPENYSTYEKTLENLSTNIIDQSLSNRIAISHAKGIKIVEDNDISYLKANGNCTEIYFDDSQRYLDTRTLKIYEEILTERKFFRIHKSYIINLKYLKEYLSEDGHFAILDGDIRLPIARNRLSTFLKLLKTFR